MVCIPRVIAVGIVVASTGCISNPFEDLLKRPVCDTLDTDAVCREGSGGMGGTWISSSTGDGSSSSESSSNGGSSSGSGGVESTGSSDTSTGPGPAVCGDGVIEGDEECEGSEQCFECTRDRLIFASAAFHSGDINGIEGANSLCRQYILKTGKAPDNWKTFIAWLSDADHDVRDRLPPTIRGRYVRTDGVVVVDRLDDLFSGTLLAPINVDEFGEPIEGGTVTGTMPDGTAAPGTHCKNWTSGSILDQSLYTGNTDATDVWWTMGQNPKTNPQSCAGAEWRLFCLEGA